MGKAIALRPEWPLYYCNRGKQYIKKGNQRKVIIIIQALDDLNMAYKYSRNMVVSGKLSEANIKFINNTLSQEREKLLTEINVNL